MAELTYVASALVMTGVVLAVVAAVLRFGDWRSYAIVGAGDPGARLRRVADSPVAWMAAFLVLTLGFGGTAVLYVSGVAIPGAEALGIVLALGAGTVLGGYLFVGTYNAARSRGRPAAQGVAEGVVLLGIFVVVVITAKLVAA